MAESYLERIFAALIKAEGLPEPIREFKLCDDRRWRGDFVWLKPRRVLVEIEGGIWLGAKGRHTNGKGFLEDCHKYNEAALRGFLVIRVCKEHINDGSALEWLKRALND